MTSFAEPQELFAELIAEAVAINEDLGNRRWPRARRHLCRLVEQAEALGQPVIQKAALDSESDPEIALWKPRMETLNQLIDQALEDPEHAD